MSAPSALFDWLVDGAPGATSSEQVVTRVAEDLCASGIALERLAVFVTTLHPSILGRGFFWSKGEKVRVVELTEPVRQTETFRVSPFAEMQRTRKEIRLRLAEGSEGDEYSLTRDLKTEGCTDYLCAPLLFTSGELHAVTFATRWPGGFNDEQLATLRDVLRPLARLAEILALRRVATNLLSTYVGRGSGERILAGRITKGDIETIRAVIWFSDVRGFTELSNRVSAPEVIGILNAVFDCQVPAIESNGGEVLKFIGDGMLAIFPLDKSTNVASHCDAALLAAEQAFELLDAHNQTTAQSIEFGLALHVGEIAYGNIGGASRLDFTAIGPAVNLAARLESLTGKLGRRLLVSEAFARQTNRGVDEIGAFELKGIEAEQRVFVPRGRISP